MKSSEIFLLSFLIVFFIFLMSMSSKVEGVKLKPVVEPVYESFLAQYGDNLIVEDDFNSMTPCVVVPDAGLEYTNFYNNVKVAHVTIDTIYLRFDPYLIVRATGYNPIISKLLVK